MNKEFIQAIEDLEKGVASVSEQFETCDFDCFIPELKEYDKNVKKHYKEYLETNEIWDKLKAQMVNEK